MADDLSGFGLQSSNNWSLGDLESMINDQMYQANNGDSGDFQGFNFLNAGTGNSVVSDAYGGQDPRAQSILDKITRGQGGYSYGGNLRADLESAYGPGGVSTKYYVNPNNLDTRTNYSDSTGKNFLQDQGSAKMSFGDRYMPMIVGTGLGLMTGNIASAAAGGGVGGAAAGGAVGSGVSNGVATGNWGDFGENALKGAVGGAAGYGLGQAANSYLNNYTDYSLPSGMQGPQNSGFLTPGQTGNLTSAAGSFGKTVGSGGDLTGALKNAGLTGLGQMTPETLRGMYNQVYGDQQQGMTPEMNDFNSALDNFDYGAGFQQEPNYGFGQNYGLEPQQTFNGTNLGDIFSGAGNFAPQEQPEGSGLKAQPANYGTAFPGMNPVNNSNPYSLVGDSSAQGSWLEELKKLMGGDAGKAGLRALAVLNPQYGKVLQGMLGGGQQGARMSPLEAGVGALASIYTNQRAQRNTQQQVKNLQSLYSNDSPYAQQLKQSLERQDAKAGRRSQYGNREVELQARLAGLNAQMAPQLQNLYSQSDMLRAQLPAQLLGYGTQSGVLQKLPDMIGSGVKSLQDMFQG